MDMIHIVFTELETHISQMQDDRAVAEHSRENAYNALRQADTGSREAKQADWDISLHTGRIIELEHQIQQLRNRLDMLVDIHNRNANLNR